MDKYIILAADAHQSYNTAVIHWEWHCDNRTLPIYQNLDGHEVRFVPDGRLFKVSDGAIRPLVRGRAEKIYVYLGIGWEARDDARQIKNAINSERLILLENTNAKSSEQS